MAGITDRWVAYLRNRERLESRDEQAHHQRPGDGGRPYASRSCTRPSWSASPESMNLGESDAEANRRERRAPPPHLKASPNNRSRARNDFDQGRPHKNTSGRGLWTSGDGLHPKAPPNQGQAMPVGSPFNKAARPPQAAPQPSSNEDDSTSVMIPQPETRPIRQDQLVAEVKGIYAGLVMVETKCIEVDNAQSSDTDSSQLNNEELQAFIDLHHPLLHEYSDDFRPLSVLLPHFQRAKVQKLASKYSLHSRAWRRLNDRLLPLLRREQDVESSRQWLAVAKLSSSLIDILSKNESAFDHPEMELQDTLDQIEAILARLQLRFRRKYDELSRKKGLAGLVFEFPDNIRHICTTMPWTISPVLVVLWGVCWMFIIGLGDAENEKPAAADPTIAPSPAAYDFHDDSVGTNTGAGFQSSVVHGFDDTGYVSLATIENFSDGDAAMMGDLFDPLGLIQAAPQDPNFLTTGAAMSSDTDSLELSGEDLCRLAETLSAAIPPNPVPQAYHRTEQRGSTGSAINVVLVSDGDQEVNSNSASQQSRPRFVCPDCQETFATSFTLNRHRMETHMQTTSPSKKLFPCPNPNCKRSKEKAPFKRPYHLKRHIENCKHNRDTSSSQEERESTPSTSTSTSAFPDELHHPAALPAEAAEPNSRKKRPRLEDEDDESSDEQLVRGMMKKYKRISEEVEEKEREYLRKKQEYLQALDDLELLAATIQVLRKKNEEDA